MRRTGCFAFVGLAFAVACAPADRGVYRDPERPIGASTRFDANMFSGDWVIVERFGEETGGLIEVAPVDQGIEVRSAAVQAISGRYAQGAPGELLPLATQAETLVVMWVDADFETAAIGTPSGSFGAVIDRDGVIPADRAQAARDILEFYGWDTAALQRTTS
ncbi:MAG: hypothetical protein AAGF27_12030 [Pseudomonadota bacterium]